MKRLIISAIFFCLYLKTDCQVINTIAGNYINSIYSGDGGPCLGASVIANNGMLFDNNNNLYISDGSRVRKIDGITNVITTIAGTGISGYTGDGGQALAAQITVNSMAIDKNKNIYICDGSIIRKINAVTNIITTVAGNTNSTNTGDGGLATDTKFNRIRGIAIDTAGNIFATQPLNFRVRKINGITNIVSSVAGTGNRGFSGVGGPALNADLGYIIGVAVDAIGNIYFADIDTYIIWKIDHATQIISIFAGTPNSGGYGGDGGPAVNAMIAMFNGYISIDTNGDIYLDDDGNSRIRKISAGNNIISTIAGNGEQGYSGDDGPAVNARIYAARHLAARNSNLYFYDESKRIRKVDGTTHVISTYGGNGGYTGDGVNALSTILNAPLGPMTDRNSNLYFWDAFNNRIRKIDSASNTISTIAGTGIRGYSGDGGLARDAQIGYSGFQSSGLAMDGAGNLYFLDNGKRIRKIDAHTQIVTTVAGIEGSGYTGDSSLATVTQISPKDLAVDSDGNIYFGEDGKIRVVDALTSKVATIAGTGITGFSGDGGPATSAQIAHSSIFIDKTGNLFIADAYNYSRIRKVDFSNGIITTIAGNGTFGYSGDGGAALDAQINPLGIFVDEYGYIYISDASYGNIRKIDPVTNLINTVAGNGLPGYTGDGGAPLDAQISAYSIWLDKSGSIYFNQVDNNVIRKITFSSAAITNIRAGNWSDPANWSTHTLPTAADKVLLNFDVTVDVNANCMSLTTQGHSVLVNSGVNLHITGH